MPRLAFPNGRAASGRRVDDVEIDRHLAEDPATCILRRAGMWGDQQDRAVRAAPWLRAAEHSAQQPAYVLRRYENLFKAGEINVLGRSEEHTSELQSLMRISYAVFCLKKKKINTNTVMINSKDNIFTLQPTTTDAHK